MDMAMDTVTPVIVSKTSDMLTALCEPLLPHVKSSDRTSIWSLDTNHLVEWLQRACYFLSTLAPYTRHYTQIDPLCTNLDLVLRVLVHHAQNSQPMSTAQRSAFQTALDKTCFYRLSIRFGPHNKRHHKMRPPPVESYDLSTPEGLAGYRRVSPWMAEKYIHEMVVKQAQAVRSRQRKAMAAKCQRQTGRRQETRGQQNAVAAGIEMRKVVRMMEKVVVERRVAEEQMDEGDRYRAQRDLLRSKELLAKLRDPKRYDPVHQWLQGVAEE